MTFSYNDISPIDLRDYLKSLGWQQREEGVTEGLIVLSNPGFQRRQLLQPQVHHPRTSRMQAREFVDKVRFQQTEKGSFILKVSAPVRAIDLQVDLFGNGPTPFIRQTTLTVSRSLDKLVTAIQTDQMEQLIENTRQSPAPDLSANLCKAVTSFQEVHNDYDLYVEFSWASALPVPPGYKKAIKIQKDYFSRIYDVAQELRKSTPEYEEESFLATVEHLAGDQSF
jgi:hypothetical protein